MVVGSSPMAARWDDVVHGVVAWSVGTERRNPARGQVPMHTAPVAGAGARRRRAVVAADGKHPVPRPVCCSRRISAAMARLRYGSSRSQGCVAVRVVAEVDLARGPRRCGWPACGRGHGAARRRPRRRWHSAVRDGRRR